MALFPVFLCSCPFYHVCGLGHPISVVNIELGNLRVQGGARGARTCRLTLVFLPDKLFPTRQALKDNLVTTVSVKIQDPEALGILQPTGESDTTMKGFGLAQVTYVGRCLMVALSGATRSHMLAFTHSLQAPPHHHLPRALHGQADLRRWYCYPLTRTTAMRRSWRVRSQWR